MDDRDRALLAEIAERDRRRSERGPRLGAAVRDRRELLRIVREQEARETRLREALDIIATDDAALDSGAAIGVRRRNIARFALRERDTQAEDQADDAAAERATAGKWGG